MHEVNLIGNYPVKKMAEYSCIWTDDKICCLLAIWIEDAIQHKLNGCYRKNPVWQKIAQELERQNVSFDRSSMQCSTMAKLLKKQYKDEVKKLCKCGVGLEGGDELLFRFVDAKNAA